MNKMMMILGALAMTSTIAACAAEPEENVGSSSDEVSVSCIRGITATPGSAAYSDALNRCLAQEDAPPAGGGYTPPPSSGGSSQSCSSSISCINGSCTCSGGPNRGSACVGSRTTGADSCSVLCRYCQ